MKSAWRKLVVFAKIPGTSHLGRLLKLLISFSVAFSTYHLIRVYYVTTLSFEGSVSTIISISSIIGSFLLLNFFLAIVFGLTFLRDDISKLIEDLNGSGDSFNSQKEAYLEMMDKFLTENQVKKLANFLLRRISEFLIFSKVSLLLLSFVGLSYFGLRNSLISAFSGAAFAWAIVFYIYPYGE